MAHNPEENPQKSAILVRGPLVLDVNFRVLTGPEKSTALTDAEMGVIHPLMAGSLVSVAALQAAEDGPPDQPWRFQGAPARSSTRMRLLRARAVLNYVGVLGNAICCIRKFGYYLAFPANPSARVFTGERAELLDHLLRTHPNKSAVARLGA
jgi:hypothetical protein